METKKRCRSKTMLIMKICKLQDIDIGDVNTEEGYNAFLESDVYKEYIDTSWNGLIRIIEELQETGGFDSLLKHLTH